MGLFNECSFWVEDISVGEIINLVVQQRKNTALKMGVVLAIF